MHRKCVLLVEDQLDNRIIYRTILEHAGFEVLEAINGEEGVRFAREHRPDLILMDLSMPVLDGWEAVKQLKSDPALASIPVCALSAHVLFDGGAERARRAGFACYLTKPLEPKQVLREVEKRIGPAGEDRSPVSPPAPLGAGGGSGPVLPASPPVESAALPFAELPR